MIVHQPECVLYSVHWLRHSVAAAGRLTHESPDPHTDRISAAALTDTLAHFAELSEWESVTLKDVADHATLMNQERFRTLCTCGVVNS